MSYLWNNTCSFLLRLKLSQWWLILLAVDFLMLVSTFIANLPEDQRLNIARPFNLSGEMNFAAWCSGMQLFLAGVALLSFSLMHWNTHRYQAKAIAAIGFIAVIFFADEIGSLHERMKIFLNLKSRWHLSLLPYFLVILSLLLFGLRGLYRYRVVLGRAWLHVVAAFFFFTMVFVQEKIEASRQWSGLAKAIRPLFEEGTELIGFAFLLIAAVTIGRKLDIAEKMKLREGVHIPVLVPTFDTIQRIFIGCMIAAVPLIGLRLMFSQEILYGQSILRGDFGYLPAVAIYALSALVCYRCSILECARRWQWRIATSICLVLSINSTALFHRFILKLMDPQYHQFPWRAERDLLWAIPLAILMLILVANKKSLTMIGMLILCWVGAAFCVQLVDGLQIATYILATLTAIIVHVGITTIASHHHKPGR